MNLIQNIVTYFSTKKDGEVPEAPEGLCPNCWGEQEWNGKYIQLVEEKQIDINNHAARDSFIKEFVTEYLSGIQLIKEKQYYHCPNCNIKYHHHKI